MKRSFRPERLAAVSARYPTHVEGRRVFLQQLGLVIGGGVLASVLPGCGDESGGPDAGAWDTLGLPPDIAAPVDVPPDAGPNVDTIAGWPDTMIAPKDLEPFVDQGSPHIFDSAGIPDHTPAPGDVEPFVDQEVPPDVQPPGDVWPDSGTDPTEDQRG